MNIMFDVQPIFNKINVIAGVVIAVMSFAFGEHWFLFLGFLLLNFGDWLTGWIKSRITKQENSTKGWTGVLKKLGYWAMIAFAFLISTIFIEVGQVIGVDLGITTLLGWFVLASLAVNECRSILENFVEAGYPVPKILVKGLKVWSEKIESVSLNGEEE